MLRLALEERPTKYTKFPTDLPVRREDGAGSESLRAEADDFGCLGAGKVFGVGTGGCGRMMMMRRRRRRRKKIANITCDTAEHVELRAWRQQALALLQLDETGSRFRKKGESVPAT
jgi:hypothetical protein